MMVRRHLVPAPARRLLSEAGPPTSWVVVAFVFAGAIAGILLQSPRTGPLAAVAVLVVLSIPSLLDVDGWRIRLGMSWLGAQQRQRMAGIPRTPAGAERWLARAGAEASALSRASMLLIAGRTAEARSIVEAAPRDEPEDRAQVARMLAALDGLDMGRVDPTAALTAIEALPPELRRYHLISLGWSTAWVEAVNKRPWRHAFAVASRLIGPGEIPIRFVVWSVTQELLAPIVVFVCLAIGSVIGVW
jgi:hypothetical protein